MLPCPDHPRSRGVYRDCPCPLPFPCGSSPLARGLQELGGRKHARLRIIPARAGFTVSPTVLGLRSPDHPRSRGVYHRHARRRRQEGGSSPLARGLQTVDIFIWRLERIIPARAGFTGCTGHRSRCPGDHPRSRGVYGQQRIRTSDRKGSSPLARGLRPYGHTHDVDGGIIPARAGFTLADPWNPNDEPHYQTAFTFTADLARAPQSSDSVVVLQQSTRPPSEA